MSASATVTTSDSDASAGAPVSAGDPIAVEAQPHCIACEGEGDVLYDTVPDRLFGTPGTWRIRACRNEHCGALWLDPRPTRQDVGKAYVNYYTHGAAGGESMTNKATRLLAGERAAVRFGSDSSSLPAGLGHLLEAVAGLYPGLHQHLDLMIRYIKPPSAGDQRLLDVGCGDGQALSILRTLGWQVMGVEFDPQAVRTAQRKGIDVRLGDLASAAFPDDYFDAVTSSHVIEHVHDPLAFLVESRRVLKPGGQIVAVTPNANAWTHGRHGRNWINLDPPRHLMVLTPRALTSLAERAGLREIRIVPTARAVALAEIASGFIREDGSYRWGARPTLGAWLRAQLAQRRASKLVAQGQMEGEELVLMAIK